MSYEKFGARLQRLRERSGLTQAELAQRCGASHSSIGNWETGLRPTAKQIPRLAKALGVTVYYLRWGRERSDLRLDVIEHRIWNAIRETIRQQRAS